jgi:hypothetical protein
MIRNFIIKYIPIELRLLREALKIYIYKTLNIESSSITTKECPIDLTGNIMFYTHPFLETNSKKYFAQIYGADKVTDTIIHPRGYLHFTSEIIEGDIYRSEYACITSKESVIPVSIPDKNTDEQNGKLTIKIDNDVTSLNGLKRNSFNYLSIPASKNVTINAYDDIIVGKPIIKKHHKPGNKKLVMSIFIDSLASEVFKKEDFSSLMPHTSKYFNDGLIFFNSYATANWTLPSVPSIMSGLYPINHNIYHSKKFQLIGDGYSTISEHYKRSGYLTCQIDSSIRKSPFYNYAQGFDRTLYSNVMSCKDVIMHTIEHLTAFRERDNYLWLSLDDVHHNLYGTPDISAQVNTPLDLYDFNFSKNLTQKKSSLNLYDEKAVKRYILAIKRLDTYLGLLYDFLKKNYSDKEIVISLCSDHGLDFLGETKERLAEYKIKVPMMFKSSDIDSSKSDEIIQNIDYLPALLKASGLDCEQNKIDGRLPYTMGGYTKREFALSEDIHQNSKYYAAVYSVEHILFVESIEIVYDIKNFDLMSCEYSLFNRKNNGIIESGICSNPSELAKAYILFFKEHRR